MNINNCHLAPSKYIIQKLEMKIVNEMVETLTHFGFAQQKQLFYFVPIDNNKKILKEHPNNWEDIKDGNFLIISGQHIIIASKLLQDKGCCNTLRTE